MYTEQVTTKTVNYTHQNSNGGFLSYLQIYFGLWRQTSDQIFNFGHARRMLRIKLILLLPWIVLIKPLGYLFSTVTRYNGTFVYTSSTRGNQFENLDLVKTRIFQFISIPFFSYKTDELSQEEINTLL